MLLTSKQAAWRRGFAAAKWEMVRTKDLWEMLPPQKNKSVVAGSPGAKKVCSASSSQVMEKHAQLPTETVLHPSVKATHTRDRTNFRWSQVEAGWWLTYPSEKYESHWEGWHPIYYIWKIKNVPNHQPERICPRKKVSTTREFRQVRDGEMFQQNGEGSSRTSEKSRTYVTTMFSKAFPKPDQLQQNSIFGNDVGIWKNSNILIFCRKHTRRDWDDSIHQSVLATCEKHNSERWVAPVAPVAPATSSCLRSWH